MKRRTLLGLGAGLVSTVGVLAWKRNAIAHWFFTQQKNQGVMLSAAASDDDSICTLTPEQTSGPYYIKSEQRADVREDRPGLPLSLAVKVVVGGNCQPVEGAQVEIWHCDASGAYSGYPEELARKPFDTMLMIIPEGPDKPIAPMTETRYLRGRQTTDQNGQIKFQTIFPGWYDPRVPHIHIKVIVGDQSYLTTQFYFPDELCKSIYETHAAYKPHGACPYNHGNDMVLGASPDANGLLLQPKEIDGELQASATLMIRT